MNARHWVCIDFGSAYIRVVRAVAATDPTTVNPQLVQFDGQSALPNLVYLTPDEKGLQEVGEGVLRLDPAALDIRRLHRGGSLEVAPDGEDGRAARLLLDHIADVLERDHSWRRDDPDTAFLVAAPIISRTGAEPAARLREAGLPIAEAAEAVIDSALAALTHATGGRPAPGRYGVIDLGAAHTRFALVDCRPDELPTVTARDRIGFGGSAFDAALLAHFASQLPPLAESGIDLRLSNIEAFKRDFAESWANGQSRYDAVCEVDGVRVPLTLDPDTFTSPQIAGQLIAEFRAKANDFFRKHAPDGDLARVLLVGGGAHWPFIYDWAVECAGADRVWRDAFPEQAVARGLSRLAALRLTPAAAPKSGWDEGSNAATTTAPSSARPRPARSTSLGGLTAGSAALLEFFGGLFGFLGLGWFFGARRVGIGCPALIGWWLLLALLVTLGVASVASDQPLLILLLLLSWLSMPALSATLLYRSFRRVTSG